MTEQKLNYSQAPDFREEYANCFGSKPSLWDFAMTFGHQEQVGDTESNIVNRVRIFMSPQQTKAMAQLLMNQVQGYEQQFGEIRLMPTRIVAPSGPLS